MDGASEPGRAGEAPRTRPRVGRLASAAAVAAVFALCLGVAHAGFGPSHWRTDVPLPSALVGPPEGSGPRVKPVVRSDYRLAVWAVARNARTLVTRPHRLFDAEPCHPAPRSLALHHPLIAPALLAVPFALATGEPVLTFNLALLAGALVSAAAMFLLVRDWTGSAAAATVAAVLYAFHGSQLGRPHHFFTVDNAWMLFALYFGRRLLVDGRWRDAGGFAAACVLQTASSVYPLLAALAVALPMGVWLVWLVRGRPAAPGRLAFAMGLAVAGAAAILTPYLLQGETFDHRSNVFYAPWSRFAPGGELFPGVVCGLLAVAGSSTWRRTRGAPRPGRRPPAPGGGARPPPRPLARGPAARGPAALLRVPGCGGAGAAARAGVRRVSGYAPRPSPGAGFQGGPPWSPSA